MRGTAIFTTIKSVGERERTGFGWIDSFRVIERATRSGRQVMAAVELTRNAWMFRALVQDRRVLTISPAYFGLESGMERRLYELARKHVGDQPEWRIGFDRPGQKVGSTQGGRYFKRDILHIVARDALPDCRLALEVDVGKRMAIVVTPRPSTG